VLRIVRPLLSFVTACRPLTALMSTRPVIVPSHVHHLATPCPEMSANPVQ
jgi:hypothetical protein